MASRPITLDAGIATDADALTGATQASVNVIVEPGQALRRRPGTTAWQTTTSNGNIIGAAVVDIRGGVLYVTSDRYIWFYEADSGRRYALSDTTLASQLAGTGRPVFAVTSVGVVIAGGGAPQKVYTLAAVSERLGGSPPVSTHIVELGQRLVLPMTQDNTGAYMFSGDADGNYGVGYYETWAGSVQYADARPDKLIAGYESGRELYLFGKTTMQLHGIGSDPLAPFEVINVLDVGMGGPYSFIRLDEGGGAWLDEKCRFVRSDGRKFAVLSEGWIQRALGNLTTISDCWGFRLKQGSQDILVWLFPTEKLGYAYDLVGKRWGAWRGWSDGEYTALSWGAHAYWFERNLHLVGDTGGSGLCKLDPEATADLGTLIKAEVLLGADDAGAPGNQKRWTRDSYVVKRGVGAFGGTAQSFEVRHRDDRRSWSNWRQHSLGLEGDADPTILDYTNGISRERERHLRWSGTDSFTLVKATAEYEVWA